MKKFLRFFVRFFYTIYFYGIFILLSNIYYLYGWIFLKNNKDAWRHHALRALDVIFYIGGIRVSATGLTNIPKGPAIFSANHQSYLDGLIVFYTTRSCFTAIIAPFSEFPGVITKWFVRMQYISIGRSLFEDWRYKGVLEHDKAVAKATELVKSGESLLIFPEGARELHGHLIPFHTGVAKVAIATEIPVVPIVLERLNKMMPPHTFMLTPTRLKVSVQKPVMLHEISKDPLEDTRALEKIIKNHLPASYFSEESMPHYLAGKRAAFFDLDGTLTRKDIYTYIILKYFREHVSLRSFLLLSHLAYKKLSENHGRFYQDAIRLLKNVSVLELTEKAPQILHVKRDEIFYPAMIELLELHRQEGNLIFILSEEPEQILNVAAHFLNVPAYGTETECIAGKFTGKIMGPIMKDGFKRAKMIELAHKYRIDLSKSYAYGNSWHDYAMLRSSAHPAVVNPVKTLRARAKELSFKIIKMV
ncbi:MAG: HAD-IB family hydrolase [Candidatus Vogelbacteria bacterium]|nr:HAD-IB family hydrolase [Candidatus Vogelbacteria bacterium]